MNATSRFKGELIVCQSSCAVAKRGQPSSDAITSCISDARLSRLESMFGGALVGESPLLPTSFANPAIDESFEAVFNPISTK